jgi:hypothetical protein
MVPAYHDEEEEDDDVAYEYEDEKTRMHITYI